MQHQNWEYSSLNNPFAQHSQLKGKSQINLGALALDTKVAKKVVASNKQKDGPQIKKILEAEEDFKIDTVSHDFKIALQKARQEKKLTQVELAQKVMEKQSVIAEYESGKAVPNNAVISKLERVLGMRLPKQKKEKAKKIAE